MQRGEHNLLKQVTKTNTCKRQWVRSELGTNLMNSICCQIILQLVQEQSHHYDQTDNGDYKHI